MPARIEVGALFHEINHGFHRHFVVAANWEVILRFALAGTLEDQRCNAARKKGRLVGVPFFLCGVEADRHHHYRGTFDTDRLAQDAGQRAALIRNLDAFAGWPQVGKCGLPTFDLLFVRGFHLRLIVHEQERCEMIVDAGALQAFARGEEMLFRQRLTAELFVMRGARRPGAAPIIVRGNRTGDLFEVGQDHAVGDKAGSPMRDSGLEQGVG